MPVKISHDITDQPTEPTLDDGKVERLKIQREALVGLLWDYSQTQAVVSDLVQRTGLDAHVQRLHDAITRHAPMETRKAFDQTLSDAILAERRMIGSTFSDHVQDLFGQYAALRRTRPLMCCGG